MKVVRRIASFAIGFVLLLSSLLKLSDPVGTSFIVEAYFNFFHLHFLSPLSTFVGVALSLFEAVVGAALLSAIWKKFFRLVSAALLGFFTLITVILLIFNPEMECGCFGEAVHLTHLQSFLKNIVLDLLWVVVYIPWRSKYPTSRKLKVGGYLAAVCSIAVFAVWALVSLPPMDYTAFAPGEEVIPGGDPSVDAVLSFYDENGEYRDSLAMEGKVMVISLPAPEKIGDFGKTAAFIESSVVCGYSPLVLTSDMSAIPSSSLPCPAFTADRRTLLTLNRSNGGAVYMADGLVVRKWPARALPQAEKLSALASSEPTEAVISENTPQHMRLQGFLLYIFAILLLL